MRILIHGFYGAANAGDDAILHAIIDEVLTSSPKAQITVIVRSKTLQPYFGPHPVRTISGFDLKMIYHEVSRSDLVLVGGGGLFQDYSGFSALHLFQGGPAGLSRQGAINYYSTPVFMAKTLGKPVYLYGLGIGPFQTREAERATAWICGLADAITVRDRGSYDLLKRLGVQRVELTADPALRLGEGGYAEDRAKGTETEETEETKDRRLKLTPFAAKSAGAVPQVGLNLREWSYAKEERSKTRDALLAAADRLVHDWGAKLKIFPFNLSKREIELAEIMLARLPAGSAELVPYEGDTPLNLKQTLGELDLVLAMRLHACILSLSAGTPAIGLSYDPKVKQFYEELGLPELCLDIQEADVSRLLEKSSLLLSEPALWRERIQERMVPLRRREERNGWLLARLIEQACSGRTEGALKHVLEGSVEHAAKLAAKPTLESADEGGLQP